MKELWLLYVLFAAPPPGIVVGWSQPFESKAACEEAAARAKIADVGERTPHTRSAMVTMCERLW